MTNQQLANLGLDVDLNYFGMFSPEGNQAIVSLIDGAKELELEWPAVYFALTVLARNPKFSEASDTVVREYVYGAMGFETPFYF